MMRALFFLYSLWIGMFSPEQVIAQNRHTELALTAFQPYLLLHADKLQTEPLKLNFCIDDFDLDNEESNSCTKSRSSSRETQFAEAYANADIFSNYLVKANSFFSCFLHTTSNRLIRLCVFRI